MYGVAAQAKQADIDIGLFDHFKGGVDEVGVGGGIQLHDDGGHMELLIGVDDRGAAVYQVAKGARHHYVDAAFDAVCAHAAIS